MDKETTPEDILEAIYVQIDEEAEAIALEISGYDPESDDIGSKFNPRQVYYEQIKRHYKAGATPYGERLVEAEELIEKMAKAFELIKTWCRESGLKHADIGNSIHMAVYHSLHQANHAMIDYQTYKQGKDGKG